MLEDKIELVDRDYENCRVEKAPRQIKTRKFSFSSILEKFTQFRIRRLEKKLEQMKDDALTDGYTETNFVKKIEKKATAIAKLEEKIMVLSKEDVPANYVKRRAIKLKKKMSDNLSFNAGSLYSIGIENKDEIFASLEDEVLEQETSEEERKIQEEISHNVEEIMSQEQSEAENNVSTDDVREVVEESFEKLDGENEMGTSETVVSGEDVRDAVEGAFSDLDKENSEHLESHVTTDEVREAVEESFEKLDNENGLNTSETIVSGEEVRAAVDESFDELDIEKDSKVIDVSKEISRDEVRDAINSAFSAMESKDGSIPEISDPFVDVQTEESESVHTATSEVRLTKEEIEAAINEVIDRIKVSKSNGASVKFDKFDENGSVRQHKDDYVYTPMTDEEIRASQEKLGFDENGNLIESQTKPGEPDVKPVEEFVYTPMTDEEIKASQEKLGFDEHGNLVNPPKADYDIVATAKVVNDERSPLYSEEETGVLKENSEEVHERSATTVEKGIDYDLHKVESSEDADTLEEFSVDGDKDNQTDESTFIPEPVSVPKDGVSAKIEDYSALKDKILYLRQQQLLTQEKKAAAQKAAEEAAALAQKAREEYEASQQSVSQSMEMLKAYSEALEEDCERNERSAEVAENDARMNKNFITMQKEKVDANNKLIDEIDSFIGPRAVPESIKLR